MTSFVHNVLWALSPGLAFGLGLEALSLECECQFWPHHLPHNIGLDFIFIALASRPRFLHYSWPQGQNSCGA